MKNHGGSLHTKKAEKQIEGRPFKANQGYKKDYSANYRQIKSERKLHNLKTCYFSVQTERNHVTLHESNFNTSGQCLAVGHTATDNL